MANQFIQSCDVASKGLRFANLILDIIFINILSAVIWFAIGFFVGAFSAAMGIADTVVPAFQRLLLSPPVRLLVACLNMFVYFFLCEALWQRTLAKLITGTKVITVNGTKPTFGAIGTRTLCRLVPFEAFSFLTGKPGGWHDWWSGTIVVRTQAAQYRQPQPLDYPVVNVDVGVRSMGIPSCEPVAQSAGAPDPTCTAVAASKTPCAQGTGRGWITMWLVAGSIAIVLAAIMVWSANRPVQSASASDTLDQREPVYAPPAAPSVYVPPSVASVPVPPPAPTPASVPSGLPPTIQVQAVVVANGKIVVYSDIGELAEGRTVSGWKVVRITGREIVLKNGDAVHTYPLSGPGTGSK